MAGDAALRVPLAFESIDNPAVDLASPAPGVFIASKGFGVAWEDARGVDWSAGPPR